MRDHVILLDDSETYHRLFEVLFGGKCTFTSCYNSSHFLNTIKTVDDSKTILIVDFWIGEESTGLDLLRKITPHGMPSFIFTNQEIPQSEIEGITVIPKKVNLIQEHIFPLLQ